MKAHDGNADVASNRASGTPPLNAEPAAHLQELLARSAKEIKNAFDLDEDGFPRRVRKWLRNEVQRVLIGRNLNQEQLSWELKWLFEGAIRSNYRTPVENYLSDAIETIGSVGGAESQADVARKIGVHPTQVMRWREKPQEVSLDTWCMVSAAADAQYKCGHVYALRAYTVALERATELLKGPGAYRVYPESVWYLYNQMRCIRWWHGLITNHEDLLRISANAFRDSFEAKVGRKATFGDLKDQVKLWEDLWLEWSLIEQELPHGWF